MNDKLSKRLISLTVVLSIFYVPATDTAKADVEVSTTEINFGAIYPMTGVISPGASSYYSGIKAYFSFVNENGGIYGRKLNLLERDSQGIAARTITAANTLLQVDNVFGFLSSAPTCVTHIPFLQSLQLSSRGVSDILSECSYEPSESSDIELTGKTFDTTTHHKLTNDKENLIIKNFIETNFGEKRIALIYQDDDYGISANKIFKSDKIICKRAFAPGTESLFAPVCNSSSTPLRTGDLVIYNGSAAGLMQTISSYTSQNLSLNYFVNYDSYNPKAFAAYGRSNVTSQAEIYTVTTNSLISDLNNEAVATLLNIAKKYAQSTDIDQRFLNGMNSGYLVANVIGAVGADLTREKFQRALIQFGNQFDVLGLSDRSNLVNSRLTPTGGAVVKSLGNTNQVVSELLVVSNGIVSQNSKRVVTINAKGLPSLKQLLLIQTPTPTPTPIAAPAPKPTISKTPIPVVEIDGEDEEPFGKISVKREKTKYTISISSNLPEELLQIRATKKGQKSIIFKVTTNDEGAAKFTTTRTLAGFQLVLLLDGEILSSVKAG